METTRDESNYSLYIAVLAAITIVIVILLISIPATKKKYNNTTDTGNGGGNIGNPFTPPTLIDLDTLLKNNKIIKLRSTATGEYYKNDERNLENTTGYIAGSFLNYPEVIDYNSSSNPWNIDNSPDLRAFSPYFQKEKDGGSPTSSVFTEKLDLLLLQKYNNPVKPPLLSQEEYQSLLNDGWYLIPMNAARIPFDNRFEFGTRPPYPFTKPYLIGSNLLYVGFVSRPNNDFPDGVTNFNAKEEYRDFILNNKTFGLDQTSVDQALRYQNVFKFVRSYENHNAFILENVLEPNKSFTVNRHSLIRPENSLSESFINDDGEFEPVVSVGGVEVPILFVLSSDNIRSNPSRSVEYQDTAQSKIPVSFYIEEAGFV